MRVRLTVSYVGTAYHGWQRQKGLRTVQECIEQAVHSLTGETVSLVGSGRTDAGVHALAQTAHFDLVKNLVPERIVAGLNHFLPGDIRVTDATLVPDSFHARRSAVQKTYIYLMHPSATENALYFNRALRVDPRLDISRMDAAAKAFIGTHDYVSFMSAGSSIKTTVRTVTGASVTKQDDFAVFRVTANGFLYNMVRLMTGVLLEAGRGSCDAAAILKLIDKHDQSVVHYVAPACGLYLHSVEYR